MYREKIPGRQLGLWLFAAMVPVGLQLLSGSSWLWVACGGFVSLAISWVLWKRPQERSCCECIFLFIYVVILMGSVLSEVADSWPVGNSDPAVPLIVLALAAWSAQKGSGAAARVGAVLFWVVLGLYLVVMAAGIKNVKPQWLLPEKKQPGIRGCWIFLLPWAVAALVKPRTQIKAHGLLWLGFLCAGTALTVGVLSPQMAGQMSNVFYEMGRSLDLFGIAQRFEALICAGATMGWFAFMSLNLTLCGTTFERIFPKKGSWGVWAAAVGALLWRLCGLHINDGMLLALGAVFWVAMPLLTQGLEKRKKS